MDKMKIISIISDWQKNILTVEGITRSYENELFRASGSKPIKIITGFRRSGKSFLVQKAARQLVEQKIYTLKNILYLNFEDYLLSDVRNIDDLGKIVKLFLQEMIEKGRALIIFDEIQVIKEWDRLIRTIYEKEQNVEIFLTGSNSELLSSELGTNLAGRFVEIKILPFSFKEFMIFKEIPIKTEIDFFREHSQITPLFTEYLMFGGLPEIFLIKDKKTKYSYLKGIISKVILDDIIKRFKVRQPEIIEQILHYIYAGVGNIISPSRIANFIKQNGVNIKQETISSYIEFIKKTFAVSNIDKFDWKLSRVFTTSSKYYSIDNGLINLYENITNNYAKQLENIIFLKLKRDFPQIFYGALQNGKEIDFIVKTEKGNFKKYQVAKTITEENKKRELSSFLYSDKYLGADNNILLTLDEQEEELEYEGCRIEKKYIIKWLLDL